MCSSSLSPAPARRLAAGLGECREGVRFLQSELYKTAPSDHRLLAGWASCGQVLGVHVFPAFGHLAEDGEGDGGDNADDGEGDPREVLRVVGVPEEVGG